MERLIFADSCTSKASALSDGFSKKGVWNAININSIYDVIKSLLNKVKETMENKDDLIDPNQQHIGNFIKKLHSFFTEIFLGKDQCYRSHNFNEEIKKCHELTKDMLDWYKKTNNAREYYEMSQSYKSMIKFSNTHLAHCGKDQLEETHVTGNLFRLQLITEEVEIKSEIKNLTDDLSDFNQWKNERIKIFQGAISSVLDKFRNKPEILFELVKLVALVKSTDKNNKHASFYQEFSTNLGLEEQESKKRCMPFGQMNGRKDDRFFSSSN